MLPVFYIIFAVIALIVSVGVAILIIHNLTQKKYNSFVLQNSVRLKQLYEINRHYDFYPDKSLDQVYTYDNEKFYDTISCKDYLIYQLQYIRKELYDQIGKIKANKEQYSKYLNEIKSIDQLSQIQYSIGKLNLNKLIEIERILIAKNTYRAPTTNFQLTVTLYCSTRYGYSKKSEIFSVDDIWALNKRLNNKSGKFYNDREIWNALCRVERGKVSNKMRFSIYERDGHRCCNCGAIAQLEIDHIIPIAKGGKSTYDNLQTLCHDCNVEKGDNLY